MNTQNQEEPTQTYQEFRDWAVRLIADTVIREGFAGLPGVVSQIVHVASYGFKKMPS